MTPEEAKKFIDRQIIVAGRRNGKTVLCDFILTVRDALDKQIPKPTLEPKCSVCSRDFAKYIEEPKHCPECGQALKWK